VLCLLMEAAYNALLTPRANCASLPATLDIACSYMATAVISANEAIHLPTPLDPANSYYYCYHIYLAFFGVHWTLAGCPESAKVAIGISFSFDFFF